MAKGKYYTPEFKEQAVKMAVGLDCRGLRGQRRAAGELMQGGIIGAAARARPHEPRTGAPDRAVR